MSWRKKSLLAPATQTHNVFSLGVAKIITKFMMDFFADFLRASINSAVEDLPKPIIYKYGFQYFENIFDKKIKFREIDILDCLEANKYFHSIFGQDSSNVFNSIFLCDISKLNLKQYEVRMLLQIASHFRKSLFIATDDGTITDFSLKLWQSLLPDYVSIKNQEGLPAGFWFCSCESEFWREDFINKPCLHFEESKEIFAEDILEKIRGKSIAVVGNGYLEEGLGAKIDAFEIVIRINNYNITAQCENRTGRKTSLWCVNGSPAIYFRPNKYAIVPLQRDRATSIATNFTHAELVFLKNDYLDAYSIAKPTIGFSMLVLLSKLELPCSAFGFDFFQRTGHYWEPDCCHDLEHDATLNTEAKVVNSLPHVSWKESKKPRFKRLLLTFLRKNTFKALPQRLPWLKKVIKKILSS